MMRAPDVLPRTMPLRRLSASNALDELPGSLSSSTLEVFSVTSLIRPTRPWSVTTGIPVRMPCTCPRSIRIVSIKLVLSSPMTRATICAPRNSRRGRVWAKLSRLRNSSFSFSTSRRDSFSPSSWALRVSSAARSCSSVRMRRSEPKRSLTPVVTPVALNCAGAVSWVIRLWTGRRLPESWSAIKSTAASTSSTTRMPISLKVRGLRSVLRMGSYDAKRNRPAVISPHLHECGHDIA